MKTKTLSIGAAIVALLSISGARADDAPSQEQTQQQGTTQAQAGDRQRLRDGTGAGAQAGSRTGAQSGTREGCDGTMKRERLRDGSGAGGQHRRMGGGRR